MSQNHTTEEVEIEAGTIQRWPHDAENPYTMIQNSLIRDESISPNCRWMLCYLLSNKPGWKINVLQIYNHVKKFIGRGRVYSLVDEAIEAGYMKKEICKKNNLRNGCKYYVSEKPIFKKCFRHPDIQEAEDPLADRKDVRKTKDKKDYPKKENIPKPPPPKNPPPLTPPKTPKAKETSSLRSEEEEPLIYKSLEDTILSPQEKRRLTKSYPEDRVIKALEISKTQTIKKTLMALLIHILDNPDNWPDDPKETSMTPEELFAWEYNQKLAKIRPDLAKENEALMEKGGICVVLYGHKQTLSFKAYDFAQDIHRAFQELP